ncbi:hypothetical protein [Caldovatus aquaticus]|uniref:Uncharacterized protein n=1 Tax=Caldovatus aquaticus TaxID=2865671 RepID=A0ABS7EXB7_9PROT|nr:hypothetical protein [Caldovatus aquaticus]MBW8268010.1 hypothetical protein [Caldovatus aquaticus]
MTDATSPAPRPLSAAALLRIVETARRFVALQEQAAALSALSAPPPLTFAEGVERDLLAFRLERAARELCEALRAVDGVPPAAAAPQAG